MTPPEIRGISSMATRQVLAEAGTGVGKTLGYIAPASIWAARNQGPVWISTYTRHLQHQIDSELDRLYPNPAQKAQKVVIRKGRENYLCLLNLEDALQGGFAGRAATLAHLVARWAAYTRDGDMVGGDLPGWLPTLFRRNGATALTDRRGECIYAGCPHFRKCFIERAARASAGAELVIANHALVMHQAAVDYALGQAVTEEEEAAPEGEDGAVFDKTGMGQSESEDPYDQAVAVVLRDKKASTSYIQRRLQIGYNRAASIMERMENEGIVGPANHAGKREILVETGRAREDED